MSLNSRTVHCLLCVSPFYLLNFDAVILFMEESEIWSQSMVERRPFRLIGRWMFAETRCESSQGRLLSSQKFPLRKMPVVRIHVDPQANHLGPCVLLCPPSTGSTQAAGTQYPTLGVLGTTHVISHGSGGWLAKILAGAHSVSGGDAVLADRWCLHTVSSRRGRGEGPLDIYLAN